MIGGGRWNTQDKKLGGAYINFVSKFSVPTQPDDPINPVEPVETDTYLYGTPSESGNIGLRVGDTVTYYKGVVLPKLPEWDKAANPYAYLTDSVMTSPRLCVSPVPWRYSDESSVGGVGYPDIADGERTPYYGCSYSLDNEEWKEFNEFYVINSGGVAGLVWSNHDVYNKTDGSLYMSATDPIPITNGVVDTINGIPIYE